LHHLRIGVLPPFLVKGATDSKIGFDTEKWSLGHKNMKNW
jgi:hypothetical protein